MKKSDIQRGILIERGGKVEGRKFKKGGPDANSASKKLRKKNIYRKDLN